MGAREFGHLVAERMAELGVSQNRLASRLGELPDGRIFDATQVRLLREGRRRLDPDLVRRLIDILSLPEDQAWHAAGLWPDDLTLEGYRRFRQLAAVGASDLDQTVMAPTLLPAGEDNVVPFDRRKRQDRRRPRITAAPEPEQEMTG